MLPANEPERLAALHRYQILDTPPEAGFDRITALAARLFKKPIVLISLVDESRAWFKSSIGFGASEVRRNDALCNVAVLFDEPLIIPDTRLDDRFVCNPFVQAEVATRFYAGAPLIDRHGFNLGTLCLLDTVPHAALTAEEEATLVDLAAMVVDELELRLAAQQIARVDAALVEITQGVSRVTGQDFFDALVQHFAKVLGTDYVYIGLVEGTEPKMMRTIATCDRGNIVENLEYRLQDTPCWEAIEQRKICCHPRNVKAQFPNAVLLQLLPVESYIAIPFYGADDRVLGLLGVMDGKPLANVQLAESLLTIFASRIATELERQQSESILTEQTRLLEAVSTGQPLDECLSALCSSIAKLSPNTRACVLLTDDLRSKFPRSITPDFPPSLSQGLKDAPINELAIFLQKHSVNGTCGTAVYCGEPVTCPDIASNESWSQSWRDVCIAHGIRACYSAPIMDVDNLPVGSLMLCFGEARLPTDWEYRLGEFGTKIASITIDRKRSIENLSESEERLSLALSAADMATWDADLSTGETLWSAKHFEILGYEPATIDAPTIEMWLSRVHPDDRAAVMAARETAQRDRSLYQIEYRLMRFDTGAVVWVASTGRFFDNQAGAAMRFVGVMFDISLRKQTEIALLESQQFVQKVAATMPGMLYVYDLVEQRNIYSNRHSLELVGYTPEQLEELGTDITPSIVHPDDVPRAMAYQAKFNTALPGEVLEIEYRVRQANGEWCWLLSQSTVFSTTPAGDVRQILGVSIDITDRKQAEANLAQSNDRFELAMLAIRGAVYEWDLQTQTVYRSKGLFDLLGVRAEDALPTSQWWIERVHPDDIERAQSEFLAAPATSDRFEGEYRIRHAAGHWIYVSDRNYFQYDSHGQRINIIGFTTDITERKLAEEELRQSQLLVQRQLMEIEAIYQTAPIGLTIFDRQLRYVRINQRLAEINGIAAEDHIGRTLREIVPTVADENEPLMHSVFATGEPLLNLEISGETQAQPGVERTWIENCYPLKDATGEVIAINIVVQEITDRKRAELAIQEGKAKLNYLLAAAEFGDWDLNLADGTAFRSLKHDLIFGYESPLAQWTYDMFMQHVLPEDRAEVDRQYQYAIANNEPWDFECRIRRADNQVRWIWASGYVYHDAQGVATRMLGLVADISLRKTTELALAERNKELDSFVHTVSHDLKAPLRAIANLSVWIEEDLEDQLPPDNQQQFQLLRTRVKRMESMIDSLLLYAKSGRQEAQLETFHLAELLAEIIDSLAPPEGFKIEIQPSLPTLSTKRVFLSQIFANLISNAIKHHTSVTGHLHIGAIEHPNYHEFIIKDDGPGIAPEHHEQVFAIFQTLAGKENSDSTGIGLAIVKKIVETEKGTIRLESSLGKGTTFYVTWPKSHH
jgi:PAS domain S-box-containing protein